MKRIAVVFIILVFTFTFAGCSGMTRTQQTTLSGAGIGAAGGAILGAVVGGSPLRSSGRCCCRRGRRLHSWRA